MENAGLVTLSGQLVLRRQLDIIADNVANMNTTGFKREMLDVTSTPVGTAATNAFPRGDRIDTFVSDWNTTTQFDQGAIQRTGAPLDVAVSGQAFIALQTPQGERYTRDGSFQINAQGQVVNKDGYAVLTSNGPLTLQPDEKDVVISRDGTIATSAGVKGKLKLVKFGDNMSMKKIGQNLFTGSNPQPDNDSSQVLQGAIETSNVQPVGEMSRMIDVTRTYEMLANMMKNHDDMRSKAIDQLGKLSA